MIIVKYEDHTSNCQLIKPLWGIMARSFFPYKNGRHINHILSIVKIIIGAILMALALIFALDFGAKSATLISILLAVFFSEFNKRN
ncbi:hypothetical protein DBZ36_11020 [Alginatibacterium sediminis]|uniref:Uncharacterized protein n=1 Tax=Alginatibacterium sediminis TaxID=2164068 RepID=A0A420EAR1_9ALTE|nr:hypothetical protein DBZ36_11020 [Alginatibacterium sediminis]